MACDVIIKRKIKPLNKISQYIFLFILACDPALELIYILGPSICLLGPRYILSTGYVAHLHSDMEIVRRV